MTQGDAEGMVSVVVTLSAARDRALMAADAGALAATTVVQSPAAEADSPMPGRVVRCLSREEAPDTFHGRVTDALPEVIDGTDLDPDQTDVYLCGSAAMVSDTHRFLGRAGYESIHTEPY